MTAIYLLTVTDYSRHEYDSEFDVLAWSSDRESIEVERELRQRVVDDAARVKGLSEYRPDKDVWDVGPNTESGVHYNVIEVKTQV